MKQVISIILIGLGLFLAHKFSIYWKEFKAKQEATDHDRAAAAESALAPPPARAKLPGMNPSYEASLETTLQAAKSAGPAAFKKWLAQYHSYVSDPRLADIELDYVLLVDRVDLPEAKRVFAEVKKRTPTGSPVYERVRRLSKTYD